MFFEGGFRQKAISIIAILFALFHIFTAMFGLMDAMIQRSVHLTFALILTYLIYTRRKNYFGFDDFLLLLISIPPTAYIILNYNYFIYRFVYVDKLYTIDILLGVVLIISILEATRRVVGWALPITASIFLFYVFMGPLLPGVFRHRGFSLEILIDYQYMFLDGIFGVPLAVSASFIVLFIIFGALMEKSGTGQFFIDLSVILTGSQKGGPAKVAVAASSIMGTVSGSAVANVSTTGIFTIPMMKRLGYTSQFAGAVEAVASTGGQFMPPIMGAAAFILAELTGIQYIQVIKHALLPAILYYIAVFCGVHFEALKLGLKPIPKEKRPVLKEVLFNRGHLVIPLFILIGTLIRGYSPTFAALLGIFSVIIVSSIKKETRMSIKDLFEAFENGAKGGILVALACACAGIIIGVVTLTGLGVRISSVFLSLGSGLLLPILIISMFVGILLGCGLPVAASYVIMAAILVPALIKLGVTTIAANLFVLYYAVLSAITPPVALASYAAASIAESDTLGTAIASVKLGLVAFLVPFMFVYSPELLLIGSTGEIIQTVITSVIGAVCFSAGISNWFIRETTIFERILLLGISFVLIYPGQLSDFMGILLLILTIVIQKYKKKYITINVGKRKIILF